MNSKSSCKWKGQRSCGGESASTFISVGEEVVAEDTRVGGRSGKQFDALSSLLLHLGQPDDPPAFYCGQKKKEGLLFGESRANKRD